MRVRRRIRTNPDGSVTETTPEYIEQADTVEEKPEFSTPTAKSNTFKTTTKPKYGLKDIDARDTEK